MANIKVSELPSASSFNDEDLVMIVQNNESKKISGENLFKRGSWTPQLSNTAEDGEPTVNYRYQTGDYYKLGNLIVLFFKISGYITAVSGSNYAGIKNLPFEPANTLSFGTVSSSFNLIDSSSMPTLLISDNKQISLQNGDNLGAAVARYKLSGQSYFECFGGIMYETSDN